MKNNSDISRRVMDQVVHIEEGQARTWRIKFIVAISILLGIFGLGIYWTIQYFREYQLFALFELFQEDWEIISEYWKDTASVIWDESPKGLIFFALCVCVMILICILVTRKKRNILKKKLQQVSAYRSKSVR
jgi:hypothetical protein